MKIEPGRTNIIHHAIWLPVEDVKNATPIPVPTTKEVVARHPSIPGLEVRIPAGVVLRTSHGEPLTYLSITPTPVNRTPMALPPGVEMPFFFVFQAHRSVVESVDGKPNPGIRIIYPNVGKLPPGWETELWNYDAVGPGWYTYGRARVRRDAKRVVPLSGARAAYCANAEDSASSSLSTVVQTKNQKHEISD